MKKKSCIGLCMVFPLIAGLSCSLVTHSEETHSAYVEKVESNVETSMVFVNLDE